MARKMTTKEFIAKATRVHGDTYDYSRVNYVNNITKVEIICPKHGSFWQTPANHIYGKQKCPKCADELRGIDSNMNTEKFILRIKEKFGSFYDCSDIDYVNNHTKVKLICPKHGAFYKRPSDIIKGQGCPKCTDERLGRITKMNTEIFIKRAVEIFGNKYDYSKVKYVNNNHKVLIICPEHGEFLQTPAQHLSGHGCKKCGNLKNSKNRSLGVKRFVERSRQIHGNKYDYSNVVYTNGRTKVAIGCLKHGIFYQSPEVHILQKAGCPKCADEYNGNNLRKSTKTFIEQAKSIHGNKYDYSKVDYKNANSKVIIICPKHGEFLQEPSVHINQRCGCPKCALEQNGIAKRKGLEQFIKEARKLHGNRYDYSNAIYVNSQTPIEIICHIHGSFFQLPSIHLNPRGGDCPKCRGRNRSTDDFIKDAENIHGKRYDYSQTVYSSAKEKVCIICPKHGPFWQMAETHLQGGGCPKCRNSRMENIVMSLLDKNKIPYIIQKRFHWLKSKSFMSLDFYLPELKLAIECQGLQHFGIAQKHDVIFKDFEKIKERDILKYKLCKERGIRIVYFCNITDDRIPVNYLDIIIRDTKNLLNFISHYPRNDHD